VCGWLASAGGVVSAGRRVGIVEACGDPELFNLRLHRRQVELLEGLERTPNAAWACGRRGGKTMLASVVCLYDLLFRPDLDKLVRRGEVRHSVAIATNAEQSRVLIRSARLIVDGSPLLRGLLRSDTADELVFERDGVVTALRAMPCSSRGIRGYAVSTGVMDEAHHFVTSDDGNAAAAQVYRALRPATAQFGHAGRMLVISSPMGSVGWFAEQWAKADSGLLAGWGAAQASTAELNPSIPADFLEDLERDEPDTFGSEYLALFESNGSSFLDMSRFEPDVGLDIAEPGAAVRWTAGLDPALTSDAFGLALVGSAEDGRIVVGPVEAIQPERKRGWTFERKRAATDRVLARVAELCREYRADAVTDQHESQAVTARLRDHGVSAVVRGMTREVKLAAFRELRDRLYDGSLVLPRHASLLDELARVQLKIEQGGAKIILPRSSRGHCDMAQALALAVYERRFTAPASKPTPRSRGDRPISAGLRHEQF
jgi:phage terminase large subunit-like protein